MTDQPSMPRCQTCKWWARYHGEMHICAVISENYDPEFRDFADVRKARIGGQPIYDPVLYTDPDFGCVHHEVLR